MDLKSLKIYTAVKLIVGENSLQSLNLKTSVQYLNGVGERRAAAYQKLGVNTLEDLLYYFPRRYLDLSAPYTIQNAPFLEAVPIQAILTYKSTEQRIRKGLSIFKLMAADETGEMEITLYNTKYIVSSLNVNEEYIFFGKVEGSLLKKKMSAPQIFSANTANPILPIYPQTAGITSKLIQKNIEQIFSEISLLGDPIPEKYRLRYNLGELNPCLKNIHFPISIEAGELARTRFIFQELLTLSMALTQLRERKKQEVLSPFAYIDLNPFYASLPFSPTGAQIRALGDVVGDFQKTHPMNRLVQGDVGSGKTLVAAGGVYLAFKNGRQSAVMVPTSILAEQHFQIFTEFLSPLGVEVALMTGSTTAKKRREILKGLADGTIHLCIGTHALLSDNVVYNNLGFVVTDEQHRFGVAQRTTFSAKSDHVHVLVMSATPIPRTLSLIIYGDLTISIIDEMPPGRQKIETLLIDNSKLPRAMGFLKKNIDEGGQVYVVCPLVEADEDGSQLKSAVEYSRQLAENDFKNYNVGLIHGKLKAKEKDLVMSRFKAGDIDLLVSTTVIEVGVDVPNATIILIESAERYGLSQLHQLRGRVGRGTKQSYCILVSDTRGEIARQRLSAMKETDDGFKLAEYDLSLRGPGDFFGFRQHGLPSLKVADLLRDTAVMETAQECARAILEDDPALTSDAHVGLKRSIHKMLNAVGQRPN